MKLMSPRKPRVLWAHRRYGYRSAGFLLVFLGVAFLALPQATELDNVYTVTPDPDHDRIEIHAVLHLSRHQTPYLKDFGQLADIRWRVEDAVVPVRMVRSGDTIIFRDVPSPGVVDVVYSMNCVTSPSPGYRKRLMSSKAFVLAREGLYIGIAGRENSLIQIEWRLPPGWQLAMGREGPRRFNDTQKELWLAGRMRGLYERRFHDVVLAVAAVDGVTVGEKEIEGILSVFQKAWLDCGPLPNRQFAIAIFPPGALGGGTALGPTLASENHMMTVIHELLHWWTDHRLPAWFREGAHAFLSLKIMADRGLVDQREYDAEIKRFAAEHESAVKRDKPRTIAESSELYDKNQGGGDIYGLAPLFARKLDSAIQAHNPAMNLWTVFAALCRERGGERKRPTLADKVDIPAFIETLTGYDARPLMKKYLDSLIIDTDELLKSS